MPYLDFLQYEYFGNTLQNYLIAVGIFIISLIIAVVIRFVLVGVLKKYAKKTKTSVSSYVRKEERLLTLFPKHHGTLEPLEFPVFVELSGVV